MSASSAHRQRKSHRHYAPELEKRCKPHLKATNDSWRVDETYVKVKKVWMYLYRAVDSQGNTLEFLLSPTRDAEAAKRFFAKTLAALHTTTPRVITVDKNAAYPKAFNELQAEGAIPDSCELTSRSSISTTSSNKITVSSNDASNQGLGFFSFETAWNTLQGYESMNMIGKGQVHGVKKGTSPVRLRSSPACLEWRSKLNRK